MHLCIRFCGIMLYNCLFIRGRQCQWYQSGGRVLRSRSLRITIFIFFGTRACTANIAMDRRYCFKEWVNQYRLKNKQTRLENEGPNSRAGQSLVPGRKPSDHRQSYSIYTAFQNRSLLFVLNNWDTSIDLIRRGVQHLKETSRKFVLPGLKTVTTLPCEICRTPPICSDAIAKLQRTQ